jgi:hypothetical protein
MNDVDLRTRIITELYERRKSSPDDVGAVEVSVLARQLGEQATRVAVTCADLVRHKHVDGDGNMMGFVRISDIGVNYVDEVQALHD